MKKSSILLLLLSILLISCKPSQKLQNSFFTSVKTDTILLDKISIRPITVSSDRVWYAADKNRVGVINLINGSKMERKINKDTLKLEFRSIAQTTSSIFIVNVGNPAFLYKFSKDLNQKKLVYEEKNEKVFYDSMQFWNDQEGIALGDPIENCFCILITRDGGETWTKIPCEKLPKIEDGEAFFAASNTTITTKKSKTWVVSGGKQSRVFFSNNKGKNWEVYSTPIVQGKSMTGIFTADFYNDKIGFISGGNYENLEQNYDNKALTLDGGKTWNLVAQNLGFGYASCVQYVPRSKGNELVSVGASGIFYSGDRGHTWKQFSSDKTLYTIRMINDVTAVAAGKNKIILIHFKK